MGRDPLGNQPEPHSQNTANSARARSGNPIDFIRNQPIFLALSPEDPVVRRTANCIHANKTQQHTVRFLFITPSYHSVIDGLKKYTSKDMLTIKDVSKGTASWWVLHLDNIQHYVHPRHFRIGCEASMKIGCAATLFGFESYTPVTVDITKKQQCIALNKRQMLTFKQLHSLINYKHLDQVCTLQILRTLVYYVPSLRKCACSVQQMYKTTVAICQLPVHKTEIYLLPTNGRNETVTSELLQALLDFVQVMGFTEDEPLTCLFFAGGDGLTYEHMVLLKLYMQFHESSFE